MSGGRPRKPRQTKIIHGTFRKDRNPIAEPEPPIVPTVPKPPSHLGKFGKKLWKDLGARLLREQLLSVLDIEAFEIFCVAYDQYRQAYEAMHHVYDPDTGKPLRKRTTAEYLATHDFQTMIELSVMNRALPFIRAMMQEFGMTPAARNKIDLRNGEELPADPMEALLNAN
jgi:P27 family predicted phage terminase small subunit